MFRLGLSDHNKSYNVQWSSPNAAPIRIYLIGLSILDLDAKNNLSKAVRRIPFRCDFEGYVPRNEHT